MTDFGRAYFGVGFDPAEVAKLQAQADAMGARIAQLGTARSSSFGRSLSGAARVARVGLLGMGLAAAYAVKQAASFQQQLNVLQAVSGATAGQMKALGAEAMRLGADVKLPATSAQDAAEALTELVKAGLSVKDAMAAARPVLQLSAAAQVDNATAAQDAATALNAFHLAGTQATHVADLLAGAANASAGNIQDFAEGLRFAGAAAHGAGQSIADTVTALAEMANAGLSGSVAGSSLAQALRALQAPSAKARDEMHKLGINIYDAKGQMLPMPKIIDTFTKATDNLTQKQKNQALATIFGSRAVQAARIVFLGGVDAFDKLGSSVDKAGNAQRLAAAQTKGAAGQFQALQSIVQTAAITFGQDLLPAATAAAGGLGDVVGVMQRHQAVSEALVGSLGALALAVVTLNAGYRAYIATLDAVAVAQAVLDATILANPYVAAATAVAGLAAALILVATHGGEAYDNLKPLTGAINDLSSAAKNARSANIDLAASIVSHKQDIQNVGTAEKRLADLRKAGKKGTDEYKQGELDLAQARVQERRGLEQLGVAYHKNAQGQRQARDQASNLRGEFDKLNDSFAHAAHGAELVGGRMLDTSTDARRAAPIVANYSTKMRAVADDAGAAAAKVGGFGTVVGRQIERVRSLALAAARLAQEIRGIPTTHQIAIYEHFYSTTSGGAPTTTKRVLPASPITPATGGLVTGGTPGRDSVAALLTPGETVLTQQMQRNLLGLLRHPTAALLPDMHSIPRLQDRPVTVRLVAESPALAWLTKYIRAEVDTHDNQLALALRGR